MKAADEDAARAAFAQHKIELSEFHPALMVEQTDVREFVLTGYTSEDEGDPTKELNNWYIEGNGIEPPFPDGTLLMYNKHEVASTPPPVGGAAR